MMIILLWILLILYYDKDKLCVINELTCGREVITDPSLDYQSGCHLGPFRIFFRIFVVFSQIIRTDI